MEVKDKGSLPIELTGRDRVVILILFPIQVFLFLFSFAFLFNYFSYIPLPHLISGPTLLVSPFTKPSYLYNGLMYTLFFVQHILMALVIFKIKGQMIWKKFPLYERYIYNIVSGLVLIWVYSNVRPVTG